MNIMTQRLQAILADGKTKKAVETTVVVGCALVACAGLAHAGNDTTFSSATTAMTNWSTGSLGKMAAVGAVAAGLVSTMIRFDWKILGGALGVGLAAGLGPGIVTSLVSATF